MPYDLETLRSFQNKQVKMLFDDDHEVIANLLSASHDMDGRLELVYDNVTWANDPREFATAKDSTCYAEGVSLISITSI